MTTPQTPFAEDVLPLPSSDESLLLQLDGFEGPIDLLLTLARDQKVDLARISILQLVEQYLAFIRAARRLRLELAADWLVMAAWLAFLKSKLLLPKSATTEDGAEEELSGEALAEALSFQLKRLEAMQNAAHALFARPQLGQHRLPRLMAPDIGGVHVKIVWQATLYDLLDCYGDLKRREEPETYTPEPLMLMSPDEARGRLANMLGDWAVKGMRAQDWTPLFESIQDLKQPGTLQYRAALASTLSAGLELAKQGSAEIYQDRSFAPVYIRPRKVQDDGDN